MININTKSLRQKNGLFLMSEVARMVGTEYYTFRKNVVSGFLPAPGVAVPKRNGKYYTQRDVAKIKKLLLGEPATGK